MVWVDHTNMVQQNYLELNFQKNNIMLKNNKVQFFISLIGFLILFVYFNYKKGLSDFFGSETDSFVSLSPMENLSF